MNASATGNLTDTIFAEDDLILSDDLYETDDWPPYLMWIQKVFASLSIICSYTICREIISDLKNHRNHHGRRSGRSSGLPKSIARILLNLSIADIIFSFAVFLGEWPAPKDTWYIHHASGSQQLCTFQGWMRALGYLTSPMFSVALTGFYLLLIRYRWQDADLKRLEQKTTIGIWAYALVLSLIPIPLKAYNSDWDVCWIVPSPLDCIDEECKRGLIANKLEIYYSFIHIWFSVFVCLMLMIVLFRTVKDLEDKAKLYITTGVRSSGTGRQSSNQMETSGFWKNSVFSTAKDKQKKSTDFGEEEASSLENSKANEGVEQPLPAKNTEGRSIAAFVGSTFSALFPTLASRTHRKSRAVAYQGILYTLAFMSTHLFDIIASIIWRLNSIWHLQFDIAAYMILQPSLGILNLLIFCRNRKMSTPEGKVLRKIFFCCGLCSICSCLDGDNSQGNPSNSHENTVGESVNTIGPVESTNACGARCVD